MANSKPPSLKIVKSNYQDDSEDLSKDRKPFISKGGIADHVLIHVTVAAVMHVVGFIVVSLLSSKK